MSLKGRLAPFLVSRQNEWSLITPWLGPGISCRLFTFVR